MKLAITHSARKRPIPPNFESMSLAAWRLQTRLGLSESLANALAALAGFHVGVRH